MDPPLLRSALAKISSRPFTVGLALIGAGGIALSALVADIVLRGGDGDFLDLLFLAGCGVSVVVLLVLWYAVRDIVS